MKIIIDNQSIEIEPELLSVSNQPINVFSTDFFICHSKISEFKNVKINLKITLENEVWNVPYLLQLKKDLKENFVEKYSDTFIELSTNINDDDEEMNKYIPSQTDIFEFSQIRYLNKPYFQIFENNFNESILKLLNYIDTINSSSISKQEYEFIDKSTFFNFNAQEVENIEVNERFVIREYLNRDIIFDNVEKFNKYHKDKWKVPHLNFKELNFNTAKFTFMGNVGGSLKIVVPEKYYSKYIPNFEEINPYLDASRKGYGEFNNFQGANIFYGTYKECYLKLNNPKEFKKLEFDLSRKREDDKQRGRNSNYDLGDWGGLYGEEAETGRWNTD